MKDISNMISIKNMNDCMPSCEFDVRVDRKTIFGNPFRIEDESQRDYVLDNHKKYFYERIKNDTDFKNNINQLIQIYKIYGHLNLFCWCYPKRCHAETIKEYILDNVG